MLADVDEMQAMLEDIAGSLPAGAKMLSRSIDCGVGESTVSAGLGEIQDQFPDVKIGSYPQMGKSPIYAHLVLRSTDSAQLDAATAKVQAMVDELHAQKNISLSKDSTP